MPRPKVVVDPGKDDRRSVHDDVPIELGGGGVRHGREEHKGASDQEERTREEVDWHAEHAQGEA